MRGWTGGFRDGGPVPYEKDGGRKGAMGAPPVAGGATRASVSGRVALRCQWQKKQGISVCSGRQMRKVLVTDEDAGYRKRTKDEEGD